MAFSGPESLVGRSARVIEAIPGGPRAGEVLVRIRGGTEAYIAYCDEAVGVGEEVAIVSDQGARAVLVTPL